MIVLNVNKASKHFGEQTLFDNVSFAVDEKDRIGFIGANGAGKTTLFKIIAGELSPDSGSIAFASGTSVGYMEQNPSFKSDKTVFDEVVSVFDGLRDIENELKAVEAEIENGNFSDRMINRQQELLKEYDDKGGTTYKSRTRSMLTGLGFTGADLEKSCSLLSGGEQTRACLAKLLLSGSRLLLLDEPTNHLDMAALEFLEGYLMSYDGAFIAISHDRYFLDRVTNKTMELRNNTTETAALPYTQYQKYTEKRREDEAKRYREDIKEIKRIEGIIETQKRFNRERNIRMAESRQKVLDKKTAALKAPEHTESKAKIDFSAPSRTGKDVLRLENVSKSFNEKLLFKNFNLDIKRGEKAFLLGANGTGKTTILNIIDGSVKPDTGILAYGTGVEIGYYRQHSVLSPSKTVFEEIQEDFPQMTVTETRNSLAAFNFFGDDVFKTVGTLSGGEKARISILKLMLKSPNFIIMDEPTNHLDLPSREALEKALGEFKGTALIVSHDRYFINKLADKIITFSKDETREYVGNYDYYLSHRLSSEPERIKKIKETDYSKQKEYKAKVRRLNNALRSAEEEIAAAESQIDSLNSELSLTGADYEKAAELSEAIESLREKLDILYEKWDEVNTEIEKLQDE